MNTNLTLGYVERRKVAGKTLDLVDVFSDGKIIATITPKNGGWRVFEITEGQQTLFDASRQQIASLLSAGHSCTIKSLYLNFLRQNFRQYRDYLRNLFF